MDDQDVFLKDIVSGLNDESVPYSFGYKIAAKIIKERERRERRAEMIQISVILTLAALLITLSLYYINSSLFNLSQEWLTLEGVNSIITHGSDKFKMIFFNKENIIWYIISVNSIALLTIERLLKKREY
ncbi:MAG: hypothetical protein Q8R90_03460 [Bacteroidales bacterium]|jgi:ABC-type glycerol-3-phosphate transport system permease component|nr:hypothetical protein [Bacteroidales bacterium]